MKIRKYACIAISAALLMTGCQATPDQDIVANKNDNQASQNETSQSVDDTIAIDENAYGKVVSEAISDSFDSTEGDVTIKVQADQVRVKNVPVLQAEAQSVSADDVKRWCNVFFGTEDVYEYRDEMTKSDIEKAILASDIGITPTNDGKSIRLVFPELTEERRKELAKDVKKKGDAAKTAVRNIRRDGNDAFKKSNKAKEISEDEYAELQEKLQKITDKYVAMVDKAVEAKTKEIMTV